MTSKPSLQPAFTAFTKYWEIRRSGNDVGAGNPEKLQASLIAFRRQVPTGYSQDQLFVEWQADFFDLETRASHQAG